MFPRFDVITLTLLHPVKSSPVQSWAFASDTVVRIGRATDNQVVLYSAVVSRHHVELRYTEPDRKLSGGWELVSLGANGTYIDAQRVIRSPITDGMVFRLARSGPNIQVLIQEDDTRDRNLEKLLSRSEDRTQDRNPDRNQDRTDIHPVQTPQTEAIAIATERYSQMLMEQDRPSIASESLFDTRTGHPITVIKSIGPYPILRELGQGSMASTYLGWRDGQTFALKQLNPEWSQNNEAIARFKQQTQQLKAITHPGVPQIVDEFMAGTQPVLAMEMVYGQTLADEVKTRGPLSEPDAIAIALEVCDILTELHAQPMVHGDIHPQHLIRRQVLRSGQEIVLIDFGSMRHYGWNVGLPPSSVGYTAPELQEAVVSAATDYYALGTTLAYLLTGEDPALFYGHQEEGDRFQCEYMTGLSPEMTTLIQHLTHPNPSHRPTSVREIEQALRTVI